MTTIRTFDDMIGAVLESATKGDASADFVAADGRRWSLYHDQDCCESVWLEDVCGDMGDLVGSPIVLAEEVSQEEPPLPDGPGKYVSDSFTWTFYRFGTNRGTVTLRFFGTSNGYYSESVNMHSAAAGEELERVWR
jgi:hypothetical protein